MQSFAHCPCFALAFDCGDLAQPLPKTNRAAPRSSSTPAQGRLVFIKLPSPAQGSYPFLVTRVHPPCLALPRLQSICFGRIRLGQWDLRTRSRHHLLGLVHTPSTLALLLVHLDFRDWQALVAVSGDAHCELGAAFDLES